MYDVFDVGAFQYLLTPFDEGQFAEIFQRVAQQAGQGKSVPAVNEIVGRGCH